MLRSTVQRVKAVAGLVVGAFALLAMVIGLVERKHDLGTNIATSVFFLVVTYFGVKVFRANWKLEREHEPRLDKLLDGARPSAGGADAPDEPGK